MISAIITILVGSAVVALILAPILHFAFKVVVCERNSFRDSYRICFFASFAEGVVSLLIPVMIGAFDGAVDYLESSNLIADISGSVLQVLVFTYLITKELGDLRKSFIIAILFTGLSLLIFFLLFTVLFAGILVVA